MKEISGRKERARTHSLYRSSRVSHAEWIEKCRVQAHLTVGEATAAESKRVSIYTLELLTVVVAHKVLDNLSLSTRQGVAHLHLKGPADRNESTLPFKQPTHRAIVGRELTDKNTPRKERGRE